ncbi:MAG: extracellular solute-binding protein family 5 [Chloroflexi bacterium]|nr:extracellular solute-binding protein family 5 [Chloroflexota bacterium]
MTASNDWRVAKGSRTPAGGKGLAMETHDHLCTLRFRRPVLRALAAASLLLVVPSPAHAASNMTLRLVTPGTLGDLDPASEQDYSSDTIARNIEETLVGFSGAAMDKYRPVLATSWSSNADQSVWTFHLRHGVTFHTGRCCMTADDVKYSIGRTVTAGLGGSYLYSRFISNPAKQIVVVDPYTVRFDLARSQPAFLAALTSEYVGLILDAKAARAHEDKKTHDAHAWITNNDIGTGPYKLQRWQRGTEVVLQRFPGYWGGWSGSHFSTIIVDTVPDSATRREQVERGTADITFNLTPQDYKAMSGNSALQVTAPYATEVDYIIMTEAGPLKSPLARQALSYAFNYDAYIQGLLGGYGKRAYGPIPSALLGYDPAGFKYQTDLNKARALLQQAKVQPGTTLTYAYGSNGAQAGQILQAQLAQIGITLKQQHLSDPAFSSMFFGSGAAASRPNLMFQTWWPDYNDPYDMTSNLIYSKAVGAAGANGGYYANKTVDSLLDAMKTADRGTLTRDGKQLQNITTQQDPAAIWVAEPAQVVVLGKRVKGYVSNPIELHTFGFYSLHM